MRAIIVDNEVHAREEIAHLLSEHGGVTVVASCANAVEALHAVNAERPDVVFLDIQMPKVSGFELLAMIDPAIMPAVVFVTAYDEYALAAFEENALDYLLKPIQPERLARAIAKLERAVGGGARPVFQSPPVERIPCIAHQQNIKLVDLADVELVRSSAAGVYVVTSTGEYFTELTLTVLETRAPKLLRCHKQYLVNLAAIDEIAPVEPGGAVLKTRGGHEVPVSRRLLSKVKDALGIASRARA